MSETLRAAVEAMTPELETTRHDLHQHPELSDQEARTSALVSERLRALGLAVREGVGGHGVVAELDSGRPGKRLAIRADMDALPIQEENAVPYRSQNPGVMHACGHDGHTTMLLGTARLLSEHREALSGSIRFLFQPAEETVGGARRMCEAGAMDDVDSVVALHGWPQRIGLGQVGVRTGPAMASADTFDITIHGAQAHAAYPHAGVDPIVVGAQIVTALQTIASRETDPTDAVVVTVGQFHAGTAYNIIPATAKIAGTVRTLDARVRQEVPDRVRRVAGGICAAARATCDFVWTEGTPPVVNDARTVELIGEVAASMLGRDNVVTVPRPTMGSEDFAVYQEYAPGAMFYLGLGDVSPIHTPTFNFDDRALPIGVELFARIALKYLA